jgi:DNA-binding NarL/FixJ family response regulator
MTAFGLTARERQIVHLIWGGETPKQIAGFLEVSDATVRKSLSRIYYKLQVPGLRELGELVHTHLVVWEEPNTPQNSKASVSVKRIRLF